MRAHVAAIKAAAEFAGYPVHFGYVPAPVPQQYVLIVTGTGDPASEVDVTGTTDDIDARVMVKIVGQTPDAALGMAGKVQTALAAPITVPGRVVWLSRTGSLDVQVDRDVTITGTNTHPAFTTDFYRLISVPA
ncbi:MAG: hypothetical protein ACYCZY_13180 [Lacisediminihabitans sp.]